MSNLLDKDHIECPICHKVITKIRATSHFLRVHDPDRKQKKKTKGWTKLEFSGNCNKCKKTFDSLWQYANDKSNLFCASCMKKEK